MSRSQTYHSTRGGESNCSFETVVLKGLASDGGLFLPDEIPIARDWRDWKDLSYIDLALHIFSLYISTEEIPTADLKEILDRSYSTFRSPQIAPLVHLKGNLHLLELFHGPSYSFKDYALQFVGNVFEYFLVRKNKGKKGRERHHLSVVGATSGDTGSAAIYGLRNKKDISLFILHPQGRVSPCQESQMTTVLDGNIHNIALEGTFDDCQNIVKTLFGDPDTNQHVRLGSVNSINFARILAQVVYYFYAYFAVTKGRDSEKIRFVTPSGNFGNILAGYFAMKMGLPVDKLVVATNENDILHRFWETGRYAREEECKQTYSPAMDILVSSNFERMVWFLEKECSLEEKGEEGSTKHAGQAVADWFQSLKSKGAFGPMSANFMERGRGIFASERVSDAQTLDTIRSFYRDTKYLLDPHSAVGVTAAERSIAQADSVIHVAISTAHPAKFSEAISSALGEESGFDFASIAPQELKDLETKEKRVLKVENSWETIRDIVKKQTVQDTIETEA